MKKPRFGGVFSWVAASDGRIGLRRIAPDAGTHDAGGG